MSNIYKIHHYYDIGNQDLFVKCKSNPVDFAVYVEFLAEEHIDVSISVWTEGIARTLVEFYGCKFVESCTGAIDVEMYFERASRCGEGKFEELSKMFASFDTDKILRFIEPYSDYERDSPTPGKEYKERANKVS